MKLLIFIKYFVKLGYIVVFKNVVLWKCKIIYIILICIIKYCECWLNGGKLLLVMIFFGIVEYVLVFW